MDSRLVVVAEKGRLPRVEAAGALAARVTGADTIHLVGAAATPLGGDTIDVVITVGPGARLSLHSVAASLVLPGRHVVDSRAGWRIDVAAGGCLDLDLEPTVVAAAARHEVRTAVTLAATARIRLRERTQIGRSGEEEGRFASRLDVDLAGRPLLRHLVELGPGTATDDVLSAPRALVGEFRYPDERAGAVGGLDAVRLPLAGGGSLTTWQGPRLVPGALANSVLETQPA